MESSTELSLLFLSQLLALVLSEPAPQFYPLYQGGHQQHFIPPHSDPPSYPGNQNWNQPPRNFSAAPNFQGTPNFPGAPNFPGVPNFSGTPNYVNPVSSAAADELLRNNMPRQSYGSPLPGGPQGQPVYPQIYKVDNLIIIANPSQLQPQPCIPQRPINLPGSDDLTNKINDDDEPSKCTWAIVACCSPGSVNVRYNCFEVLGCPGFFFDNSPCEPKTVMAAAAAALDYYRNANNATSTRTSPRPGDTNTIN